MRSLFGAFVVLGLSVALLAGRVQGKKEQASDLLAGFVAAELRDPKKCPSEHPTSSYHRVARISAALGCISTFSPKRDLAKLKKVLERASACASNNMAEG